MPASFICFKKTKTKKKKKKNKSKNFRTKKFPKQFVYRARCVWSKKATDQIVYYSRCVSVQILPWQNYRLSQMCFRPDCRLGQIYFGTNFVFSLNFLLDKTKLSKKLNKKPIYFLLIKNKIFYFKKLNYL